MHRYSSTNRAFADFATRGLLAAFAVGCAVGADDLGQDDLAEVHAHHHVHAEPAFAERASAVAKCLLRLTIEESHAGRGDDWSPGISTRRRLIG